MPKNHAPINLSSERQQMIGVKIGMVSRENVSKEIKAVGRVAFDPEFFNAQNDYVVALRNLESLRDSPVAEAVDAARRMMDSARLRLRVMGISDDYIRHIEQKRSADESILVAKEGRPSWIVADIFEVDVPDIKNDLAAEITGESLRGKRLMGKVAYVDRTLDPTTRTLKARILVEDSGVELLPQGYVDVKITVPLGEEVVVPLDAVLATGNEAWVFVTDGDGYFEPRLITVKSYLGNKVVVGHGLSGNEKIVMSANFLIDSESRLRFISTDFNEHVH